MTIETSPTPDTHSASTKAAPVWHTSYYFYLLPRQLVCSHSALGAAAHSCLTWEVRPTSSPYLWLECKGVHVLHTDRHISVYSWQTDSSRGAQEIISLERKPRLVNATIWGVSSLAGTRTDRAPYSTFLTFGFRHRSQGGATQRL